jgi:hypothetical protein
MRSCRVNAILASISILVLSASCSAFASPDDVLETSSTVGQIRLEARLVERSVNHVVFAIDVTNTGATAVDVGVDSCSAIALYPVSPLRLGPVWYEPLNCPDIVRDSPSPLPAHETRRLTRDVPLEAYVGNPHTVAPETGSHLVAVHVRFNAAGLYREFWMATGRIPISIAR